MLKGISPLISPALIKVLMEMGHGDELVFGDGNFPAASHARQLIRADGHGIPLLLGAVLDIVPLDYALDFSAIVMEFRGDREPAVWSRYREILSSYADGRKPLQVLPKPAFYERAGQAYCVVATSESESFANLIIRKGVIRV